MPFSADPSSSSKTIGQHIKLQRPMKNLRPFSAADEPLIPKPSKSAMSSFFLLPTSNETTRKKKPNKVFPQTSSFRGFGCTSSASQQISVPEVIRSSADWDASNNSKINKTKTTTKKKKNKGRSYNGGSVKILSEVGGNGCAAAIPDVWCGPGVGFSTDAVVDGGSIDPVESDPPPRRNIPARRKIDKSNFNNNNSNDHREESSVLFPRRSLNQESNPCVDSDLTFLTSRTDQTLFSDRYHSQTYPDGLSEMMMIQNGFVMGGILSSYDHFRDMRLNLDGMSYEQLLELGDRIGYVNTGLNEKQIKSCLRKVKPYRKNTPQADRKCIICQEDYEAKDEVGKLRCGHRFHINCVKQWLMRKNTCPICKTMAYVKS